MSPSGGANHPATTPVLTTASEADFWAVAKTSLAEFTSRLGGGGFGDLRVEGSKPHHSKGHQELFQVKELLENIQAKQARILRLEEHPKEEDEAAAKKPSKMNANSTAAVKNVIAEATDSKFRDLSIKFDDVLKRLEKSEKKNERLEEQLGKFEAKARKSANSTPSMQQHLAALTRVEKLEQQHKRTETSCHSQDKAFKELEVALEKHGRELARTQGALTRHDQLEGRVSELEQLRSRINEQAVQLTRARTDTRYDQFEARFAVLERATADLTGELEETDISALEDYYRWVGSVLQTREWLLHVNNRLAELQTLVGSNHKEFRELYSEEDVFCHKGLRDLGKAYHDGRIKGNDQSEDGVHSKEIEQGGESDRCKENDQRDENDGCEENGGCEENDRYKEDVHGISRLFDLGDVGQAYRNEVQCQENCEKNDESEDCWEMSDAMIRACESADYIEVMSQHDRWG